MTIGSDHLPGGARRRVDVEELFRNVPSIESIDDLAAPGVFASDEELDELLVFVRTDRDADLV